MTITLNENRSRIIERNTRAKLSNNPTSLLLLIATRLLKSKLAH